MAGTKKLELTFENHIVNLMDQLGQGVFGVVYRGHHKSSAKELIAAKRVSLKNNDKSNSFGQTVMREIKALDRLDHHDHIIRLIDFHYQEQCFWLIMEFCEKGDLQEYSKKEKPTIDFTIKIMLQITSALKFLHDNKVIHRDLKPGNILLRGEKDNLMAKVTDFGFSRIGDKSKSDEEWLLSSDAGTFAYKAPEFFDDKIKYTMTVDTFALGLMLLALVLSCENTNIKELFPLSVKSLERGKKRTVGQEMFDAHDDQRPLPEIVRIRDTDDNKVKESKELVKKMCAFTANDRMPLKDVLYTLSRLSGNSIPESTEKVKPKNKDKPEVDLSIKLANEAIIEKWNTQYKELKDAKTKAKASEIFLKLIGLDQKLVFVNGIGVDADELKAGDEVRVNPDRKTFEENQQGYGGYTPEMASILNKTGRVARKILHVFSVKFASGKEAPRFILNESNLTRIDEDAFVSNFSPEGKTIADQTVTIKEDDIVRILEDKEKVMQSQVGGKIGWNDRMEHCLGYSGIVLGVRSNGSVTVRCINGEVWIYNPDVLTKLDLSNVELEIADLVIVTSDREELERLQRKQGVWIRGMDKKRGKLGILKDILGDGACVLVEIGGDELTFNRETIRLFAKSAEYMNATTKKTEDDSTDITPALARDLTIR